MQSAKQIGKTDNDHRDAERRIDEVLERSRKYPRIVVDRPAEMIPESGEIFRVRAYDISPDGVQLRCDPATAGRFDVDGALADGGVKVHLRLALPVKEEVASIKMLGRLAWKKQLDQNEYAVGMRITEVMGGSAARLQRFIEQSLEPR